MSAITAATAPIVAAASVEPAAQTPNASPAQANAVAQASANAAAVQPTPAPATEPQDTVIISSAAQGIAAQPTSSQVALLSAEGESVAEIAQQLGISQQAVQSYLG